MTYTACTTYVTDSANSAYKNNERNNHITKKIMSISLFRLVLTAKLNIHSHRAAPQCTASSVNEPRS